jgi:hypothetical protein
LPGHQHQHGPTPPAYHLRLCGPSSAPLSKGTDLVECKGACLVHANVINVPALCPPWNSTALIKPSSKAASIRPQPVYFPLPLFLLLCLPLPLLFAQLRLVLLILPLLLVVKSILCTDTHTQAYTSHHTLHLPRQCGPCFGTVMTRGSRPCAPREAKPVGVSGAWCTLGVATAVEYRHQRISNDKLDREAPTSTPFCNRLWSSSPRQTRNWSACMAPSIEGLVLSMPKGPAGLPRRSRGERACPSGWPPWP